MNDRYRPYVVDATLDNNSHSYVLQMLGWGKRVLELGPASGAVTEAMVKQNCTVTCIEGDENYRDSLEQVAAQTIIGDLNDARIFDEVKGPFDVVVCGDILEHLLDPVGVLTRAAHLLAPGGQALVSVPNIAHADIRLKLLEGRFEYTPAGLLDETHIRFYTRSTAVELARKAGLVIFDMRTVVIPVFGTEQAASRGVVPDEVLHKLLQDPDAQTYQFVFAAVKDDGDHRLNSLAVKYTNAQYELDQLKRSNDALQSQVAQLSEARTQLAQVNSRLERAIAARNAGPHHTERTATNTQLELELAVTRAELAGYQASKTLKYTAAPRAVYRKGRSVLKRIGRR